MWEGRGMADEERVIHKFIIDMGDNSIALEKSATFLYAATDSRLEKGAVWVARPTRATPVVARHVFVAATGDKVPAKFKRPLGLIRLGEFIFHAFSE